MKKLKCLDKYAKLKKVLLLYSGGLDTSFLLKYFTTELKCEVVTLTVNLGGAKEENKAIAKRARQLGSVKHIEINAKKDFVTRFCSKAIKSNALYQNNHPLSSSLSRPLMAEYAVKVAAQNGCKAIMHGSNAWQNNSGRFDNALRALNRNMTIIEPTMECNIPREFEHNYLAKAGFLMDKRKENLLSSDNNLWGREIEDGVLEHQFQEPPEEIYKITKNPLTAPAVPEYIEIEFKAGMPIKLNGKKTNLLRLVEKLNQIAGNHGIGRHDSYEDKIIGHKTREIHESPAATVLITSHRDLEQATLPKTSLAFKTAIDQKWVELACFGLWFHPLREQLEAFTDKANERVSGTVRLKLYKGSVKVVGRKATNGLYQNNLVIPEHFEQSPNRNFYDYYSFETLISN